MMKAIEFYWGDLTEEKQKEILDIVGDNYNCSNWNYFPIAALDIEIEE